MIQTTTSSTKRVLVTGASGFIGGRLCEVMALTNGFAVRAFIHSTAAVARIARLPLDFVMGDLCDRQSVDKAMDGCDAVVHLARGGNDVMREGLQNVLESAAAHKVSRFVHMSSVAVYGNNPPPESVTEAAPAKKSDMAYGNEKLAQENRVLRAWRRRGLPIVILRPPNVYGPYSAFSIDLIRRIRNHRLAVVDGGRNPCNIVYVDNLVQAILLSLVRREAIGEVFFIRDGTEISWKEFLSDHAFFLDMSLPEVASSDLSDVEPLKPKMFRDSFKRLPRVLLSGELRTIVRQIPIVDAVEKVAYNAFQSLSADVREHIRWKVNGPVLIEKDAGEKVGFRRDNIHMAQGRTVLHSYDKAARLLDYKPVVSYKEGMNLTRAWLEYARSL